MFYTTCYQHRFPEGAITSSVSKVGLNVPMGWVSIPIALADPGRERAREREREREISALIALAYR